MSTVEYLAGLIVAIATAILMSFIIRQGAPILAKIAIGVFIGFTGFLIGMMVTTVFGGLILNALVASVLLSLISWKSWPST
jgi:hypothetical protein